MINIIGKFVNTLFRVINLSITDQDTQGAVEEIKQVSIGYQKEKAALNPNAKNVKEAVGRFSKKFRRLAKMRYSEKYKYLF